MTKYMNDAIERAVMLTFENLGLDAFKQTSMFSRNEFEIANQIKRAA